MLAASSASFPFFSSHSVFFPLQLLFNCLFRFECSFLVSSFSDIVFACCILYFALFLLRIIFQVFFFIQISFCEPLLLLMHSSATSVTACLNVPHCSSTFGPRSCKTWNLLCKFSLHLPATSSCCSFSTAMGYFKDVLFIFMNLSLSEALISWWLEPMSAPL